MTPTGLLMHTTTQTSPLLSLPLSLTKPATQPTFSSTQIHRSTRPLSQSPRLQPVPQPDQLQHLSLSLSPNYQPSHQPNSNQNISKFYHCNQFHILIRSKYESRRHWFEKQKTPS
ncbi:hypothetical protein KC19_VG324500 [Ceratodon purpureus]|uniref:Uncharacterized protein n=1 Tax=Ceratodon purpureus TaxID=3225 RepID=A0A8T0HWX6_CERPU|nr:hypothetical protein KC19_VG324500 [Ceratodon purpureus]